MSGFWKGFWSSSLLSYRLLLLRRFVRDLRVVFGVVRRLEATGPQMNRNQGCAKPMLFSTAGLKKKNRLPAFYDPQEQRVFLKE